MNKKEYKKVWAMKHRKQLSESATESNRKKQKIINYLRVKLNAFGLDELYEKLQKVIM